MSWLSKCRGIPVGFDKNTFKHLGLIQLACALLWYRHLARIEETCVFRMVSWPSASTGAGWRDLYTNRVAM
jgi:hypothetical protein